MIAHHYNVSTIANWG